MQQIKINSLVSTLFLIALWPTFSYTQTPSNPNDTLTPVTATGIGMTLDKALESALQSAVSNAIGTYVSSETMVKNNMLIKDEILSYSGGYVQKYEILSKSNENGVFTIQIQALVKRIQLINKMKSLNLYTKDIDGGSLFGEAFTKINTSKNAVDVIKSVVAKYPQQAYVIKTSDPKIVSTSDQSNIATIELDVTVSFDSVWLEELENKLTQIAISHETSPSQIETDTSVSHVVFTSRELLTSVMCSDQFAVDHKVIKVLYSCLNDIEIVLTFQNDRKPIAIKHFTFDGHTRNRNRMFLISYLMNGSISICSSRRKCFAIDAMPFYAGFSMLAYTWSGVLILQDYSYTMPFQFNLSLTDMKQIKQVVASVAKQ